MSLTPSLRQEADLALASDACLCGAIKKRGQSFCAPCYFALPKELRYQCFSLTGQGYAEAWDEARDWLRYNTNRLKQKGLF